MAERIVVGIDSHMKANSALLWAAAEAAHRNVSLDLAHAWTAGPDVSPIGVPGPATDLTPFEDRAQRILEEAIARVPPESREHLRELNPISVQGSAAGALLDASKGANLLVVGTRRRGAVTALLGSVSHQCAHHAHCPLAVVPPGWSSDDTRRIVVGVDGSLGSTAALRWALEEASSWTAVLEVVHSWSTPYPVEPWGTVVTPRDQGAFDHDAQELMRAMVDRAVRTGAPRPPEIRCTPVHDASGPALVDTSASADLLVVGSRGRGGFAALLLGSTSLHCLHHSSRPIVIVPTTT